MPEATSAGNRHYFHAYTKCDEISQKWPISDSVNGMVKTGIVNAVMKGN